MSIDMFFLMFWRLDFSVSLKCIFWWLVTRFFYENGGWPSSFALEQLQEIRKMTMSGLLCDNTDHVETVQVHAFVLPDKKINPRVPCRSSKIPRLDLSKWKDSQHNSLRHSGGDTFFSGSHAPSTIECLCVACFITILSL